MLFIYTTLLPSDSGDFINLKDIYSFMEKVFAYISFGMAFIFGLMATAIVLAPPDALEGFSPLQRYLMAGLILVYAAFRFWRARKILIRIQEEEAQTQSGIERDE
jgi:hypothetical protein